MSGLEPVAALGFACNILQLVDAGRETIDLITAVYQGRSPDDTLGQNARVLGNISNEIKTYKRPATCPRRHEQQLLDAAGKCATAAQELREEVRFLMGNAKKGSLTSALKVAAKTNWRRRRLQRLKENLDGAEKLMHTSLLAQIW